LIYLSFSDYLNGRFSASNFYPGAALPGIADLHMDAALQHLIDGGFDAFAFENRGGNTSSYQSHNRGSVRVASGNVKSTSTGLSQNWKYVSHSNLESSLSATSSANLSSSHQGHADLTQAVSTITPLAAASNASSIIVSSLFASSAAYMSAFSASYAHAASSTSAVLHAQFQQFAHASSNSAAHASATAAALNAISQGSNSFDGAKLNQRMKTSLLLDCE
jgi:hypothetical protein